MKAYLMSGENYTMQCSDQELISNLIELYTYNYKIACDLHKELWDEDIEDEDISDKEENAYKLGKADGAVDALSTIMLSVLGGGEMYDIWQKTMKWANRDNLNSK